MKKRKFIESPYEFFNIKDNPDNLKKQYLKLIRKYSPENSPEKFMQIRSAYEKIKKPYFIDRENVVLYKSSLSFFENSDTDEVVKLDKSILKDFFETPFDTNSEIKDALKINKFEYE